MLSEKSADFHRYVPEEKLNLDAELTTWKLYILICTCSQACAEIFIKAVHLLKGIISN